MDIPLSAYCCQIVCSVDYRFVIGYAVLLSGYKFPRISQSNKILIRDIDHRRERLFCRAESPIILTCLIKTNVILFTFAIPHARCYALKFYKTSRAHTKGAFRVCTETSRYNGVSIHPRNDWRFSNKRGSYFFVSFIASDHPRLVERFVA